MLGFRKLNPTYGLAKTDGEWMYISSKKPVQFTTKDSEAELVFDDGSLLRLAKDTSINISAIVPDPNQNTTIAQANYESGLLWGRVLNADKLRFSNGGFVVGVRGTSVMMDTKWEIKVLQWREPLSAIRYDNLDPNEEISKHPKCSVFSAGTNTPLGTKDIYCLGDDKNVIENTLKDIAYLNTLIAENVKSANIKAERNIAWPQKVEENRKFCQDPKNPIFWPNLTHSDGMCQGENVIGLIVFDGESAKIYYQDWWSDDLTIDESKAIEGFPPRIHDKKIEFTNNSTFTCMLNNDKKECIIPPGSTSVHFTLKDISSMKFILDKDFIKIYD